VCGGGGGAPVAAVCVVTWDTFVCNNQNWGLNRDGLGVLVFSGQR